MHTIAVRNVNYALPAGMELLRMRGVRRESRNGAVIMAPFPVTTTYRQPRERVLLIAARDANPFFHLAESMWMLAGRNDLGALTPYVKRMAQFSDDGGKTQPGAYGFRWREHFGHDQLEWAIKRLDRDEHDRRVVIQMWDPATDIPAADAGGRDVPCNLTLLPWVNDLGELDMTVFCRSNDIIWGAYGANAVHFTVLQEYIAQALGRPVGLFHQVSNNFHAYEEVLDKQDWSWPWPGEGCPYTLKTVRPSPLQVDLREVDAALALDLENVRSPYLCDTVVPMLLAHEAWRNGHWELAHQRAARVRASDWRVAAQIWLAARDKARAPALEAAE